MAVADWAAAGVAAAAAAADVVRFGVIVIGGGAELAGSVEAFRPPTPEVFFRCCGGLFATGVFGVKKVDDEDDDDLPVPPRVTSAG